MLPVCVPAEENRPPERNTRVGVLALLNLSEEDYTQYADARRILRDLLNEEGFMHSAAPEREDGFPAPPSPPSPGEKPGTGTLPEEGARTQVLYYDTLSTMLIGLNAGDIGSMEIYQTVARYLAAANDNLVILGEYDLNREQNTFARAALSGILSNDFAFLMLDKNTDLRDEFNKAIGDMKEDGTMEVLVQQQITDVISGGEILPITLPQYEGAETVRVAVTGSLPPMDYVAADGTPAGFNTAVLAEIGTRLHKNIELVVVNSLGRAAALAGETVDAVFWTRTNALSGLVAENPAKAEAEKEEIRAEMSDQERSVMDDTSEKVDFAGYSRTDMSENTIITDPYYSDVIVAVELRQ